MRRHSGSNRSVSRAVGHQFPVTELWPTSALTASGFAPHGMRVLCRQGKADISLTRGHTPLMYSPQALGCTATSTTLGSERSPQLADIFPTALRTPKTLHPYVPPVRFRLLQEAESHDTSAWRNGLIPHNGEKFQKKTARKINSVWKRAFG